MATITGLTAARMLAIEAASIVDGDIVGDNLILTKHDATTINAGNVRGPAGTNATPFAVVTALPGSPTDGQEIFYQNAAMATAGIIWHLRYRAAAAAGKRWEAVGQQERLAATFTSPGTVGNATNVAFPGAAGFTTFPLAGDYDVELDCYAQSNSGAGIYGRVAMVPSVAGVAKTAPVLNIDFYETFGGSQRQYHGEITGVAAGNAVGMMHKMEAGASNFIGAGAVRFRPLRVG